MPFTVATCKPISRIKETTAIPKKFGETFTLQCPSHPCTAASGSDVDTYNFTKITAKSGFIHQGRVFRKVISDVNDTTTYIYCCVPYCACAKDTEPCCISIKGSYLCMYIQLASSQIHILL